MTKGRTSQANAEFYLDVRKCLQVDKGQSAEDLEVLVRNLVAVEKRWAATRRSAPRGRRAQVQVLQSPASWHEGGQGQREPTRSQIRPSTLRESRKPREEARAAGTPGPWIWGEGKMANLVHMSNAQEASVCAIVSHRKHG